MKKKPVLAIVGMGQFGTFMKSFLEPFFTIVEVRRNSDPSVVCESRVVVFAVSYEGLLPMIKKLKKHVPAEALICDVTSIKQKPLSVLKKYFPKHQIIGTHPVFGPQSGKNGIKGMPITVCNVTADKKTYKTFITFLHKSLGLHVIEQSPKEHDAEMAHVQALTHFIGRALLELNIQDFPTNTKSYAYLLKLCDMLRFDSYELFRTIEVHNPQAKNIRKKFLKTLMKIEKSLD